MEAATAAPASSRIDESTATTLWQRITKIEGVGTVNLASGVASDSWSAKQEGVEEGERYFQIEIYGNIEPEVLEKIRETTRELGRHPEIRSSALVIR